MHHWYVVSKAPDLILGSEAHLDFSGINHHGGVGEANDEVD